MKRALVIATIIASASLAVGASCNSETASPSQLGDAGASTDTGALSDAIPTDASDSRAPERREPSEIGVEGDWVPAGSLPSYCSFHVSRTPEKIPPFPWKPCSNGVQGCESFIANWDERGSVRAFEPSSIEPVFEDARGVHITYERQTQADGRFSHKVVQTMTGPGEAAFAIGQPACGMTAQASRYGVALSFIVGEPVQPYVGWGDIDKATQVATAPARLTPALIAYQGVARGDGFLAVEATNFGAGIYGAAYDLTTSRFGGPTTSHTLPNDGVLPVDGGYIAVIGTRPPVLGFVPLTGSYEILARPSAGLQMFYASVDRKQNSLAWSEFDDNGDFFIWTSPLAKSEPSMQPRRVAKVAFSGRMVVNAGTVVVVVDPSRARIIRVSDGMGWDLPAEAGLNYVAPLWANDDSVWFLASKVYSGGRPRNAAVRFSRSDLGSPTVPSGL